MFVKLSVFTLDIRPSTVGRINIHPTSDLFRSIRVVPEVTEGFVAVLIVKLAVFFLFFFFASPTLEIATKASAALAD